MIYNIIASFLNVRNLIANYVRYVITLLLLPTYVIMLPLPVLINLLCSWERSMHGIDCLLEYT